MRQRLKRSIQRLTCFAAEKQNLLDHYFQQKIQHPENLAFVKAEIARLSHDKKQHLSHLLVKIMFADGDTPLSRVSQDNIEHLYLALGVDNLLLTQDVERLFPTSTSHTDFFLDRAAVEAHELQTKAVQTMLYDVFEEQPEETIAINNDELDAKHERLYLHLITQSIWSKEALKQLADEYKLLMIHGMIAKINRWACEHVGYSVFINEKNGISVDAEIVKEINNK